MMGLRAGRPLWLDLSSRCSAPIYPALSRAGRPPRSRRGDRGRRHDRRYGRGNVRGHYARWTDDDRLLIGGSDRPLVSGKRRAAVFTTATRELREHFERLFPALTEVNIDYAWEGVFAVTPDGLPYIGVHQRYPLHLFALG